MLWRGLGAVVGLALGLGAVLALREATLSTHQAVPPDSSVEFVVHSRVNRGERSSLDTMTESLVRLCELEVAPEIDGPVEDLGDDRFRFVLRPALDDTDRTQFRGCVEDWKIDNLLVDVESMVETPPDD